MGPWEQVHRREVLKLAGMGVAKGRFITGDGSAHPHRGIVPETVAKSGLLRGEWHQKWPHGESHTVRRIHYVPNATTLGDPVTDLRG